MFQFCGHCLKKLNAKNKRDMQTGFCSVCRRPPADGQLSFLEAAQQSVQPTIRKQAKIARRRVLKNKIALPAVSG